MGGSFMPDDDARAPWLAATRALAREALERVVPYFGICLGGQLLAHVAGGTVTAGHPGAAELGSTTLTIRPEAAGDPLFRALPATVTAVQRHVDAITSLPRGALWLASSERCAYQAFRSGECAWGAQFHPETTAARIRSWDPELIRRYGLDPVEVHHRAARDEPEATPVWRTVARRFAEVVRRY